MDDPTRRNILKAGAAAAAMSAMPRVFAQQAGKGGTGKFYEKGPVRIRYEEAGAGFPLMLLPGGGLNATISFFTGNSPFNAIEEFKVQYRCITADLRNATTGQSTGLSRSIGRGSLRRRPTRLMDHLGIDKFMVMGFCIGGPFIWSLLKRAPIVLSRLCWRSPWGGGRRCATRSTQASSGRPGSGTDCPAARDHDADGRQIRDQDVRDRPSLRLRRDIGISMAWVPSIRPAGPDRLAPTPTKSRCHVKPK